MDWLLRKEEVCVILREQPGGAGNVKRRDLQVVLKASGTKIPLTPGNTQCSFIQYCIICPYKLDSDFLTLYGYRYL